MNNNFNSNVPLPINEPVRNYIDDYLEWTRLEQELEKQSKASVEIPIIINGKEIYSGESEQIRSPHNHDLLLGKYHKASPANAIMAIKSAKNAANNWVKAPWQDRAAIFLKAANLLTTKYRYEILAATMLTQSKTSYQAEIDAVCEPADATLVFVNGSSDSVTYPTTTTWQYSLALIAGANAISVKCKDAAGNESSAVTSSIAYDNTAPTAPTSVALAPFGGNIVANLLNTTNTNLKAQATIVAGDATGGEAELLLDGNAFIPAMKDTNIAAGETSVNFDFGLINNSSVQAKFPAGGVVSV